MPVYPLLQWHLADQLVEIDGGFLFDHAVERDLPGSDFQRLRGFRFLFVRAEFVKIVIGCRPFFLPSPDGRLDTAGSAAPGTDRRSDPPQRRTAAPTPREWPGPGPSPSAGRGVADIPIHTSPPITGGSSLFSFKLNFN